MQNLSLKRLFCCILLCCGISVTAVWAATDWMQNYQDLKPVEGTDFYLFGQYDVTDDEGNTFYGTGVITKEGKVVHEPIYFYIDLLNFEDGRRRVQTGGNKYGFMDASFNLVIPCIYDDATVFEGGYAIVSTERLDGTSKVIVIDKDGKEVPGGLPEEKRDDSYYIELLEKELKELNVSTSSIYRYDEQDNIRSKQIVCQLKNKNKYVNSQLIYGLADLYTRELLLPLEWDYLLYSKSGVLWGYQITSDGTYDCYKFTDKLVPEKQFNSPYEILAIDADDLIIITRSVEFEQSADDDWWWEHNATSYMYCGIMDTKGTILIEPNLETLQKDLDFEDGYLIVQKDSTVIEYIKGIGEVGNGKFGCMTKQGQILLDFIYDEITYNGNHVFSVTKDGVASTIDLGQNLAGTQEGEPDYSPWAKEAIERAIELNLVPSTLQSSYKKPITRGEFCVLAMALYTKITGEDIAQFATEDSPFTNTNNPHILAAYSLQIVSGMGDGGFLPDNSIKRQEAAKMLDNLAGALSVPVDTDPGIYYADHNQIPEWARSSVYAMSSLKTPDGPAILNGTGQNQFSPLANYTRQESIATILRLFDVVDAAQG